MFSLLGKAVFFLLFVLALGIFPYVVMLPPVGSKYEEATDEIGTNQL
jgi:hypothetical protein